MINLTCYRLCVFATGSLTIEIFSCFTLTKVSCLHLGQNSGKFSSTVSSRILARVLLPQIGHNIHWYLHILLSPYFMFFLASIILMSQILYCFSFINPHCVVICNNEDNQTPHKSYPNIISYRLPSQQSADCVDNGCHRLVFSKNVNHCRHRISWYKCGADKRKENKRIGKGKIGRASCRERV